MMRILIVEDDLYKSTAISNFLSEDLDMREIICKESLSSGLFEIIDNMNYSLILLDMSMPSFDVSDKDPVGGIPESFAGEDFLAQMTLLGIEIPVIIVTQFDTFRTGDDSFPLTALDKKLEAKHPNIYNGAIFFRSTSNEWKNSLKNKILEVLQ